MKKHWVLLDYRFLCAYEKFKNNRCIECTQYIEIDTISEVIVLYLSLTHACISENVKMHVSR